MEDMVHREQREEDVSTRDRNTRDYVHMWDGAEHQQQVELITQIHH